MNLTKFERADIEQVVREYIACCCSNTFSTTTLSPPTHIPGTNDPKVLYNEDTGEVWGWNGSTWVLLIGGALNVGQIGIKIDGGGAEITSGYKDRFRVPFDGLLTGWDIFETSETPMVGDIEIDVSVGTYLNYDTTPTFVNLIPTAPNIFSGVKNKATGLSIPVSAGDLIEYTVTSASDVEIVQLYLILTRT